MCSDRVVVRVPVDDKATRDITFPADVFRFDFRDRIIAAMNVDGINARLGWKTSDEKQRTLAHQLQTDEDADQAIKTILDIQRNPRRRRAIVLEIIHLVGLVVIHVCGVGLMHLGFSESRTSSKEKDAKRLPGGATCNQAEAQVRQSLWP